MSELKKAISDYLQGVWDISLATIDGEGKPYCTVVAFVNESDRLFFVTGKPSNKFKNIEKNPDVAFTANKPGGNWMDIQSVQMQGKASAVTDGAEINRVLGLLLAKFPPMKDIPQSPDFAMVKVKFTRGYFLDYAKGFGFREEAVY